MNADRGIVVPGVQVDVETKQTRKVLKKEVNDQQLHLMPYVTTLEFGKLSCTKQGLDWGPSWKIAGPHQSDDQDGTPNPCWQDAALKLFLREPGYNLALGRHACIRTEEVQALKDLIVQFPGFRAHNLALVLTVQLHCIWCHCIYHAKAMSDAERGQEACLMRPRLESPCPNVKP